MLKQIALITLMGLSASAAMAAIKSQMKEDHKKIFTAEQLKKMEEMKKHKMDRKAAK